MFKRKTPYEKEWENLIKQENRFISSRLEKKENLLNRKLDGKVPEKLHQTLDDAFVKAFQFIFDKGTGIIEKTYQKDRFEKEYRVNEYTNRMHQTRQSYRAFSKKAAGTGRNHSLVSGAAGVGMGVLGIGIPDIPVFTSLMLRGIYEIAMSYGFEYESEEERIFILLVIEGAMSHGYEFQEINTDLNEFIEKGKMPTRYEKEMQIERTAKSLSNELLYMKFLQGIPIVGAVGGMYDAVYIKQITEYAKIKYRRKFLRR